MPTLPHARQERFAQNLAKGKTTDAAYVEAGYKPNRFNSGTLKQKQCVIDRVRELHEKSADRLVISRLFVTDALLENVQKALGRAPVRIGPADAEREIYVYRGDVANRAIQMAGLELGMFVQRTEIKQINEFQKLSDEELVRELAKEAQRLLDFNTVDVTPVPTDPGENSE